MDITDIDRLNFLKTQTYNLYVWRGYFYTLIYPLNSPSKDDAITGDSFEEVIDKAIKLSKSE